MSNTIMSYFCNTARTTFTIRHMQSTKSRVLMNSDVKYGCSIITHFLVVQILPRSVLHSCLHLEINRLVAAVNKRGCRTRAGAERQTECGMNRDAHHRKHTLRRGKKGEMKSLLVQEYLKIAKKHSVTNSMCQ